MNENRLIKYDPELNTIPLRKFTPAEMNLLFGIISEVQGKKDELVILTFEDLKDLSNYKPTANKRFVDDLYSTYSKLLTLRFGRMSENGLDREMFVLFTEFKIVSKEVQVPHVELQVYSKAIPILNDLSKWVRFNYSDFVKLNSSYSKTMFRLLKQYRTTGYVYYDKSDFYELLDVPKSYKKASVFDNRVLKPIIEELSPIFTDLQIRKRKSSHRGRAIQGFEFIFKPERKDAEDIKRNNDQMLKDRMFNLVNNDSLSYEQKRKTAIKIFNDFSDNNYQDLEDKGELPGWAKIPEKQRKSTERVTTSNIQAKNKVMEEEQKQILALWIQIFGMNGLNYASKQLIELSNSYPTKLILEQIQQYKSLAGDYNVTMLIDMLKNSLKHAYAKELEKKSESIVEKQNELSEVEKLKQELAKVKQENADLKSKKDRGLFESSDLKQSEEKIAHTLDKLIPDLKDNEENTKKGEQIDLF